MSLLFPSTSSFFPESSVENATFTEVIIFVLPAVLLSIPLVSICILSFSTIRRIIKPRDDSVQINLALKLLTVSIFTFFSFHAASLVVHFALWQASNFKAAVFVSIPSFLFYGIGKLSMMTFWTLRMYLAFESSVLQVSKRYLYPLFAFLALDTLCYCCVFPIVYKMYFQRGNNAIFLYTIVVIISESIYCLIVWGVFVDRLTQINTIQIGTNLQWNDNDLLFVKAATKYTLLCGVAMISSALFSWLLIWRLTDDTLVLYIVTTFFEQFDSLINTVCIYLQFYFASDIYKSCCAQCDVCIGRCFVQYTKNIVLKRKRESEIQDLQRIAKQLIAANLGAEHKRTPPKNSVRSEVVKARISGMGPIPEEISNAFTNTNKQQAIVHVPVTNN